MSDEDQNKAPDELDESGQDWGDDWESAFQSEEELFSEEEPADEIQTDDLDESWDEVLSVSAETESTDTAEDLSQVKPPVDNSEIKESIEEDPSGPSFFANLKVRFSALPLYVKLASSMIPIVLLILLIVPFFMFKDQGTETDLPDKQPVSEKKSTLPAAPEKIRAKWPLTSFFIPVTSDKDQSIVFLNLDLTMILLLDEEKDIPSDDVSRARDLVYQFYINRPLYELRRFALARGEMNNKLRSWIRKQWPDVDLETIVFDHYELI